jgi:hypothetical protein
VKPALFGLLCVWRRVHILRQHTSPPHLLARPSHLMLWHPQICATTPTHLGITPRRCSTNSLGKIIPATVQHYAERPVSAPWHCAAYFCTANTSSPRRGTTNPRRGTNTFLCLHKTTPWRQAGGNGLLRRYQPCTAIPATATHCNATPGTATTSPTLLRRMGIGHRHARHCASYGLLSTAPSSQHAGGGRPSNLYATTLEAALVNCSLLGI